MATDVDITCNYLQECLLLSSRLTLFTVEDCKLIISHLSNHSIVMVAVWCEVQGSEVELGFDYIFVFLVM